MLNVKKLDPRATLPTVAHPGEDLAYDVYSLDKVDLWTGKPVRLRTGIAVQAFSPMGGLPLGLLIRDRSSMAAKGVMVTAGVVDHGYTGEIQIVMTYTPSSLGLGDCLGPARCIINAGDKIAQMIPIPILTGEVFEVEELEASSRGEKGFGSTGQ